jgi:hypothetical protein
MEPCTHYTEWRYITKVTELPPQWGCPPVIIYHYFHCNKCCTSIGVHVDDRTQMDFTHRKLLKK